ncbi:uncharacterized protein P884DRAFT_267031 [Thermothelomyces heterothallicus CBS 202.75]|uniref:uncharacterized protein n=1 Tax=Thermothelomyces heterothallicus CBS 202.75 TaxID=1149848 RepID=UPI0037437DEC
MPPTLSIDPTYGYAGVPASGLPAGASLFHFIPPRSAPLVCLRTGILDSGNSPKSRRLEGVRFPDRRPRWEENHEQGFRCLSMYEKGYKKVCLCKVYLCRVLKYSEQDEGRGCVGGWLTGKKAERGGGESRANTVTWRSARKACSGPAGIQSKLMVPDLSWRGGYMHKK